MPTMRKLLTAPERVYLRKQFKETAELVGRQQKEQRVMLRRLAAILNLHQDISDILESTATLEAKVCAIRRKNDSIGIQLSKLLLG